MIDAPAGESLDRNTWQDEVRPAIQQSVPGKKLEGKLRCLVTVWDVPLKIGRTPANDPDVLRRAAYLDAERRQRVEQLQQVLRAAERVGVEEPTEASAESPLPAAASPKELEKQLNAVFGAAGGRIQQVSDAPQQQALASQLEQLVLGRRRLADVGGQAQPE